MIEHRLRRPNRTTNDGFTLVELLVVVVILGILSAVVVFAVRGAGDKGKGAAVATDERTIRTAQEAYCAQAGQYATMGQLTGKAPAADGRTYKFLSEESKYHALRVPAPSGSCNGTGFEIVCKDGGVMPNCGALAPGGHPLVDSAAVCPQPNGWCVDAATPGGTPYFDQTQRSMVQLPNGKVFAVYKETNPTCTVYVCTGNGKSGLFDPDPAKQPDQRWTAGPTIPYTGYPPYSLYSLLVIEGTAEQCGARCGQVLANLALAWRLYNPTDNTWTPTPPSPFPIGGRAVQLTGSKDQCGDRCGQVLAVTPTNFGGRSAFYDPKTNTWTPGPDIDGSEFHPVVALLSDGRVLVLDYSFKNGEKVAKLIDPKLVPDRMVSDAAKPTQRHDSIRTIPARLPDGKILFTDEIAEIYSPGPRACAADQPQTCGGSWATVDKCGDATDCQVVAQLSDGRVLARASDNYQRNAGVPFDMFLFYPSDGDWHRTGPPTTWAPDGIGVLVADRPGCGDSCNKVLTVGTQNEVPTAELYTPPPP